MAFSGRANWTARYSTEVVVCLSQCYRHTMIKRKSHNLDEELLRRARRILGTTTETEAIHEALRAVLVRERIIDDLRTATRPGIFRSKFVREMRRESKPS